MTFSHENQQELVDDLAASLYRLQWDVDLCAPPRGIEAKRYERHARKLLASGYYKEDVEELARNEARRADVLARHHVDYRYDTALHEQCTCGKRWMVGPGKLDAHHAEILSASPKRETIRAFTCPTCVGLGCGDCA